MIFYISVFLFLVLKVRNLFLKKWKQKWKNVFFKNGACLRKSDLFLFFDFTKIIKDFLVYTCSSTANLRKKWPQNIGHI